MHTGLDEPVYGATIETADLVTARFAARYLNVTRASRALAHLAGAKRSTRRGRGVEFDEVRQYAAGDDVRAIDWRVTARSGEAHTKLFHEERERPVLVAVDLRPPMQFGSVNCFKSVLAARVASLVLWSALDRGERVGGMVFAGADPQDVRPRRSRRAVLSMIGDMQQLGQQTGHQVTTETPTFADQLKQLQRITRPGSSLFLISDFHDGLDDASLDALRRLASHIQITAIAISDPLEQQLPSAGRYVVADDRGRYGLNTGDANLRRRYEEAFARQQATLTQRYQRFRIPVIGLSTATAPLPVLQRYFPAR